MFSPLGKHVVSGGAAAEARLSGPSDGAGDRGDPPALPGQEAAHPRCHRGQKTKAAELLRSSGGFLSRFLQQSGGTPPRLLEFPHDVTFGERGLSRWTSACWVFGPLSKKNCRKAVQLNIIDIYFVCLRSMILLFVAFLFIHHQQQFWTRVSFCLFQACTQLFLAYGEHT